MSTPEIDVDAEARRVLHLCNICGYCNGYCVVFDAAARHPLLTANEVTWLAQLCHGCGNCLYACQYAPPHPFAVNVPQSLAQRRWQDYQQRIWPRAAAGLLIEAEAVTRLALQIGIGLAVLCAIIVLPWATLWAPAHAPGDFYRVVPLSTMTALGGLSLSWAVLVLMMSWWRFWRQIAATPLSWCAMRQLIGEIISLRQLSGGGVGCHPPDDRRLAAKRGLHQLLLFGMVLCVAATLSAALLHHGLGQLAPYGLVSWPVVLGTLGGGAILVAGSGLLWLKQHTDPDLVIAPMQAADRALLRLLLVTAGTGLALLISRATPAMGLLLVVHLGSVTALFLLLPYSKFVHVGYRVLALLRHAIQAKIQ